MFIAIDFSTRSSSGCLSERWVGLRYVRDAGNNFMRWAWLNGIPDGRMLPDPANDDDHCGAFNGSVVTETCSTPLKYICRRGKSVLSQFRMHANILAKLMLLC